MTFKELLEAVEVIRLKGDSISIQVSIWVNDYGRRDLKWEVWSASKCTHFEAQTAELALAKYKDQMPGKDPGVDPVPDPRQHELIDAAEEST